jgi:hypothetical protein
MDFLDRPRPHSSEASQVFLSQQGAYSPTVTGPELEAPKVLITGNLRLCVTELEAALHPITGRYNIEMTGMRQPLYTLWHAEGQVLCRQARSANIAFDVRGARAGETRIYLVAVQATERGVQGRVVQSGVFVRVVVTGDNLPTAAC